MKDQLPILAQAVGIIGGLLTILLALKPIVLAGVTVEIEELKRRVALLESAK